MYPRIRKPLKVWIYTVLTGGIYLLFWVGSISREINIAEERVVLKVDVWKYTFLILSAMCLCSTLLIINDITIIPTLAVCIAVFVLYIHIQVSIGNYIKSKEKELRNEITYSNSMSIFLFWFVANSGVAYMQHHINRIIEAERSNS